MLGFHFMVFIIVADKLSIIQNNMKFSFFSFPKKAAEGEWNISTDHIRSHHIETSNSFAHLWHYSFLYETVIPLFPVKCCIGVTGDGHCPRTVNQLAAIPALKCI